MDFKPSPRSGYTFTKQDALRGGILSGAARRAMRDVKKLRRYMRRVEGECPECKRWIFALMFVHPRTKPESQN